MTAFQFGKAFCDVIRAHRGGVSREKTIENIKSLTGLGDAYATKLLQRCVQSDKNMTAFTQAKRVPTTSEIEAAVDQKRPLTETMRKLD